MAEHIKIKCENIEQYKKIRTILDILAIEHFQRGLDKPIHLCDKYSEKEVEKILKKSGIKKYKLKLSKPNFKEIIKKEEKDDLER